MSNYEDLSESWNSGSRESAEIETRMCTTCRGTGEDRDGADCVTCHGYGDVELV